MNNLVSHAMVAFITAAIFIIIMITFSKLDLRVQDLNVVNQVNSLKNVSSVSIANYGFDRNWDLKINIKTESGEISLSSENKDLSLAVKEVIRKYELINGECK